MLAHHLSFIALLTIWSIALLQVIIARTPLTPQLLDHLLVEVKEDLDLLWLQASLQDKLIISDALTHFMHTVHVHV